MVGTHALEVLRIDVTLLNHTLDLLLDLRLVPGQALVKRHRG